MTPYEIKEHVSWARVLEEAGVNPGRRCRTRCVLHGGENTSAFSYRDESSKAHCFSCGWHGDKLDFLQAALHSDFRVAFARLAHVAGVRLDECGKPDPVELHRARVHRAALAAARDAYRTWQRLKFRQLVALKFDELLPEVSIAEIAYRAISRCPDLYPPEERSYWVQRLGSLYDQLTRVEQDFDVLLFRENEEGRFQWWQEEVKNARQLSAC